MNIKQLIKEIINKVFTEEHQTGEWWIDDTGGTIFADGSIGDSGHEGVIISMISGQILSHFGIDVDDPGYLNDYKDKIKENLIEDGRLSEEEIIDWEDGECQSIILKKVIEDGLYKDPKQASEAVQIAYGYGGTDARDFGMRYMRWKIMKASRSYIEVQTWHLTTEDLKIIVRGISDIMEYDDEEDPEVNITVEATGKRYENIPLSVLEKKVPTAVMNYRSGLPWELGGVDTSKKENIMNIKNLIKETVRSVILEDFHHYNRDYRLYEGNKNITAIFEDNSKLSFEVHYRDNHGEDKLHHRKKAMSKWKSLASQIHNNKELTEQGNEVIKTWKECFLEALRDPSMKEYIRKDNEVPIFDNNKKDVAPVMDPINFTQTG